MREKTTAGSAFRAAARSAARRAVRVRYVGIVGIAAVALVAAACSTGGTGGSGSGGDDSSASPTPPTPRISFAMTPSGDSAINPTTPIVVTVSDGALASVTVKNAKSGADVSGEFDAGRHTWTSTEVLGYGDTYTVSTTGKDPQGLTKQRQFSVTTIDPDKTAYPNMVPAPGAVQSIGVGQPIVFRFTYPVQNKAEVQKHLEVSTSPEQQGAWYWIDDKNVHYRPKEFWQPGTTIHVTADIYGLDFGDGVYGETDRSVTYEVHDSWIAKANGATSHMKIYHNGTLVKTMPISMGKPSTPTHRGIHVVSYKNADYIMDSCTYGVCEGDPGYYRSHEKWSVRISNDGEFVHENLNSLSAQGSTNVSHGCINLNTANATWFYHHFGLGDVVEVVNSGGSPLPVYDLYGDWSVPWSQWKAGNASQ